MVDTRGTAQRSRAAPAIAIPRHGSPQCARQRRTRSSSTSPPPASAEAGFLTILSLRQAGPRSLHTSTTDPASTPPTWPSPPSANGNDLRLHLRHHRPDRRRHRLHQQRLLARHSPPDSPTPAHTTPTPAGSVLRVALTDTGSHVVTVTATQAADAGYLTAYDCAQPRPNTSIVNYIPGVDTANLTIATGTELCVYTSATVDIIVDQHGRITAGTANAITTTDRHPHQRRHTTRPGQTVMIPPPPPTAATRAINITATQATNAGFFTLHPCNTPPPTTSALNYTPGRDIANLAIIPTNTPTCITTSTTTHLIIDLAATIS